MLLVGVGVDDAQADVGKLASKIFHLRVFGIYGTIRSDFGRQLLKAPKQSPE